MVRPFAAWLAAPFLLVVLSLVTTQPGHAQSGLLELSGTAVDFGAAEIDAVTGPRSIVVTNRSDLPVTIAPLEVSLSSEAFGVDVSACLDVTLDAGESCSLAFTFVPTAAGAAEATGTISATVLGLPIADREVRLTGVGEVAESGPAPTPTEPAPAPTETAPAAAPSETPAPTETAPGLPATPRSDPSPDSAVTVRADRPILPAAPTPGTDSRDGTRDTLARAASPLVPAGRRPAEVVLLGAFALTTVGYVIALAWTWYARHRREPAGRDAPSPG